MSFTRLQWRRSERGLWERKVVRYAPHTDAQQIVSYFPSLTMKSSRTTLEHWQVCTDLSAAFTAPHPSGQKLARHRAT